MDGQHRLGGITKYIKETNSELNVPFLAFHCLDEDEEIRLFDVINTKAKGIGSSLSRFLRRDSDELSWVATELMVQNSSPFFSIGSIIGKRNKDRHITLQNLYKTLHYLTKEPRIASLSKEEKLSLSLSYFDSIRQTFENEWSNYKDYRLTHIVCLDALSIAGSGILDRAVHNQNKRFDYALIEKAVRKLKRVDWSMNGPLKYLKGLPGSRSLAEELKEQMLK